MYVYIYILYTMTVLGKGTFGCVVSPALKCTDLSIKPDKRVSKIMREKDALDEMKEYEALDRVRVRARVITLTLTLTEP